MEKLTPAEYAEANRYLPPSVTSKPGFLRFAVNPYMKEIVNCFDFNSPVREINVKKGVQITFSTLLESGVMYFADYIGTVPIMYMTADKKLAAARVENNFIPMFDQSGKGDIFRSSDTTSTQKTGKTKDHLQFAKGGYMVPFGAQNADKMRSFSICVLLKDEIDAWPAQVGKDGNPDTLSDSRTDGFTERAKIFRGSTPLLKGSSFIEDNYLKGDQRQYNVYCRNEACKHLQVLRWEHKDEDGNVIGGFKWDLKPNGSLDKNSVRYECPECGHAHYEHDKEVLFSEESGAHWVPTAVPIEEGIRSYHIPALYSPIGMRPWWKCVLDYINAYDPVANEVIDVGKLQVFYNNILAEAFEVRGSKVGFQAASAHRRTVYKFGEIPNTYARQYSGGAIAFLTCQVDVHDSNLAVSVMGWTPGKRCYVIDYWRFERGNQSELCSEVGHPVWQRLRELIEEKIYIADDGTKYQIAITFIDASYANDTVTTFCAEYAGGVYPILGRDRPGKNQTIREFSQFTTQAGTIGFKIVVDHYKDRMSQVLRRDWAEEMGVQNTHHFNAPVDVTDKQLTELTREVRRKKTDDYGVITWAWYRPGNAPNELWDLLGYGHAAVEVLAWSICIEHFELKQVNWPDFWTFATSPEFQDLFGRIDPP